MPDTQISTPFNIHQFVNDYEFRGDGGDHIPTDSERAMLEDAITGALTAALAGHVVVPREPTAEMYAAWMCDHRDWSARYRAMIDAAPPVSDTPVSGWRDIASAPKDGTRVLVVLKDDFSGREDMAYWAGVPFVARHPGLAESGFDAGWNFAAPVGHGGFPDKWIAGWQPLPAPPVSRGE